MADWASVIVAAFTVAAIIGATVIGYLRFGWFRTFEPHVNISHKISHRRVGTRHIHLSVEVGISNTSKVIIPVRRGRLSVQQVAPSNDEDVEALHRDFTKGEHGQMQWPLLEVQYPAWEANSLVVEPGETDVQTVEFIIPNYVQTALIRSFYYNERVVGPGHPTTRPARHKDWSGEEKTGPRGWSRATIYDISSDEPEIPERTPEQKPPEPTPEPDIIIREAGGDEPDIPDRPEPVDPDVEEAAEFGGDEPDIPDRLKL